MNASVIRSRRRSGRRSTARFPRWLPWKARAWAAGRAGSQGGVVAKGGQAVANTLGGCYRDRRPDANAGGLIQALVCMAIRSSTVSATVANLRIADLLGRRPQGPAPRPRPPTRGDVGAAGLPDIGDTPAPELDLLHGRQDRARERLQAGSKVTVKVDKVDGATTKEPHWQCRVARGRRCARGFRAGCPTPARVLCLPCQWPTRTNLPMRSGSA